MQRFISTVLGLRVNPDSSRRGRLRGLLDRWREPRRMLIERLEDRALLSTLDVTATITADNHYALYVGNEDGSQLTLIGWNEPGVAGDPGAFNWSLPETWTFSVGEGSYIYVLAWDDGGPQMWTGQFILSDGTAVYSDLTAWVYTVSSGPNPTTVGRLPSVATVTSDIAGATWTAPVASAPQGSSPWFGIPGLPASAQLLWHDTLGSTSSSDDHYAIFRTSIPLVPIVPNRPPDNLNLNLSAATIDENGTVSLDGAFRDDDIEDTHTVVIDWGPGEVTSTLNLSAGVLNFHITHQYLDDAASGETRTPSDAYPIGVIVTDSEGDGTSGEIGVTVNNVAPVVTAFSSSSSGCGDTSAGEAVTVSGAFTDVGTLDTHSAVIDWGDGSRTVGEADSPFITGQHSYSSGGVYRITLTVSDDDGGVSNTLVATSLVTGVGLNDGILYVVGTGHADLVTINRQGNDLFKVHAGFLPLGNFTTVSSTGVRQIVVALCGGDDHLNIAGNIRIGNRIERNAGYAAVDFILQDRLPRPNAPSNNVPVPNSSGWLHKKNHNHEAGDSIAPTIPQKHTGRKPGKHRH
jgi:hypothetical protein